MSGDLVMAVLSEAWVTFKGFPPDRQEEIARWVRRRVEEIRSGRSVAPTVPPVHEDLVDWYTIGPDGEVA